MLPLLYSFRRCPFAIRARMTLCYAEIDYELREVSLKDKPNAMLITSAKATVPVLVLPGGSVLDESLRIMNWALQRLDPDCWLVDDTDERAKALLNDNDTIFKQHLDLYKYADRFPEHPARFYRHQASQFLDKLEEHLQGSKFLLNNKMSIVDVAVFPFIRQFAFVDKPWFDQAPYPALQAWLQQFLDSALFNRIMSKHSTWQEGDEAVIITA